MECSAGHEGHVRPIGGSCAKRASLVSDPSPKRPSAPSRENTRRSATVPLRAPRHEVQQAPAIPARILNEYVYCPRLAYLEWVQKEFEDSSDTVQGRHVHRRVDKQRGALPPPDAQVQPMTIARSVELSSSRLGLIAKIDLVEAERGELIPVDYKRGKRPHVPRHAYDPERVQLCAQGMLLEEHGYRCSSGVLYFAASRERVRVPFDEELRTLTLQSINELRELANGGKIPPPLEDSPKCPRCSLVGICLPDEINWMRTAAADVRPLTVHHARAMPLYVQSRGGKVAKRGERLVITSDDQEEPTYARLADTSQVVLMGNIYITTPALHELMRRNIPVTWQSYGGWFLGHTVGTGHANVELRTAQYRNSFDAGYCLRLARGWVQAKIRNSRTMLRRNWRSEEDLQPAIKDLKRLADRAGRTRDMGTLLGIEGAAAAIYFQRFSGMLRRGEDIPHFEMHNRNRRPPTDPVNALLSFGYAVLTRTLANTLTGVGLDAYRGFFHQPRYGRPALALDMMEPFRPLIVDSSVILAINNGEVTPTDFVRTPIGTNLSPTGRKRFLGTIERRLSQAIIHPIFGYRVEYRRLLEIQSRLLGRHLLGEIDSYPNFTTR